MPPPEFKVADADFVDFKVLKDGNGNSISWNYLVELQKLQESEGYHLANRLRLRTSSRQKSCSTEVKFFFEKNFSSLKTLAIQCICLTVLVH